MDPLTDRELDELRRDVIGWTGGNVKAAYAGTASGQILRALDDLRSARKGAEEADRHAKAVETHAVQQVAREIRRAEAARAALRRFADHVEQSIRSVEPPSIAELRRAQFALDTGNADASPPSDSSAALREARRLLGEAEEWVDGSWDMPDKRLALLKRIRAFLGEQNGKD